MITTIAFQKTLIGICFMVLMKYVSAADDPPKVTISPNFNPYIITNETAFEILACEAVASIPVAFNFSWYHNGSLVSNGSSYSIRTVTLNTNGKYTCQVASENGVGSKSTQIIVQYGPTVNNLQNQLTTEGDQLAVTCSARANPNASIFYWTKTGDSSFRQDSYQLVLNSIKRNESGTYTCHAQNTLKPSRGSPMDRSDTESMTVEVRYPPTVTINPTYNPYYAYDGQSNIVLTCTETDANPPTSSYKWKKDNSTTMSNIATLNLASITKSSQGTYTCQGTNSIGTGSKTVRFDVQYGPTVNDILNHYPIEGDAFKINCSATSNPPSSFYWSRNGDANFRQKGDQLVLNNIHRSQADTYTCHAYTTIKPSTENAFNRSHSESTVVDVRYVPDIVLDPSTDPYIAYKGQSSISIRCNGTNANPKKVDYTWSKDKSVLFSTSQLQISSVALSDEGTYTCVATNSAGSNSKSIKIDVQYAPKLTITSSSSGSDVFEGKTLILSCSSDAKPHVSAYWWILKDGTRRTGASLTINSTKRSDSGGYTCHAQNTLTPTGTSSIPKNTTKQWNVNVQYGPDSTITLSPAFKNKTLNEGDQLDSVQCTATCSPTCLIRWQTPVRTFSSKTLPADTISKSEAGIYSCTAWNKVSTATASFTIDVLYKPTITSGSFSRNSIMEKTETVLRCNIDSKPDSNVTVEFNNSQIYRKDLTLFSEYKILSTDCLDTGYYLCSAKNNLGNNTRSTYLRVFCGPRLDERYHESSMLSVRPNATSDILEASFHIVANPEPDMTWIFRDTAGSYLTISLTDLSDDIEINGVFVAPLYKVTLKKYNFTTSDDGEYIVTLSNAYGPKTILTISTAEIKSSLDQTSLAGPIAGGVVAFFVVTVAVVIGIVILWRRREQFCNNPRPCTCFSGINCRKKQTPPTEEVHREEDPYVNQEFGDTLAAIHNNNKNRNAAAQNHNNETFVHEQNNKALDSSDVDDKDNSNSYTTLQQCRSDSHHYTSKDKLQETSLNEEEKGGNYVNLKKADPHYQNLNLKDNNKKKQKTALTPNIYENAEQTLQTEKDYPEGSHKYANQLPKKPSNVSNVAASGSAAKASLIPAKTKSTANTLSGENVEQPFGTVKEMDGINKESSKTTIGGMKVGNTYTSAPGKSSVVKNELATPKTKTAAIKTNVDPKIKDKLAMLLNNRQ